eukprot:TRINITY_DN10511_c0_g1_i1.p1 TRINITY_DN10511_c0_g1~~TRINITY_DN10511_c0_g1_i1.p1  ORF type:complete len:367 (-),score=56.04 TRINITY_DN10511_c0_g1_i1:72-1172(-)
MARRVFTSAVAVLFLACNAQCPNNDLGDGRTCSGSQEQLGAKVAEVNPDKLLLSADALEFAIVSDLDKASRNAKKFSWHAFLKRGVLRRTGEAGRNSYKIEWLGTDKLETMIAAKNRSMELSDIISYDGKLLAFCDISGLVFEVSLEQRKAFARLSLPDGNGNELKPYKSEWATIKDGVLLVGSMGREWVGDQGQIEHFNSQWIKSMDRNGKVESINWRPVFQALRAATQTSSPGYLWHEAVIWDARLRRWLVLPRKASVGQPYTPELDETRGTNLLLICSEDFSEIEVKTIGPLEPEWGFTAIRKVPGTNDTYFALKSLEVGDKTETKAMVFDLSGQMLLDPGSEYIDAVKYEGIEFIGEHTGAR